MRKEGEESLETVEDMSRMGVSVLSYGFERVEWRVEDFRYASSVF